MPELGLTHSPNKQHQDEGPSNNADSASQKVGTVLSVQDSPLSSIPRGTSWEDGQATEGIDQAHPLPVSLPVNTTNSPVLKSLQEHKSKGPSDRAARTYILGSDKSVAEVLSLTSDRTSPKPYCRYPSSSQTPPASHNVLRSSSSYSGAQWDGPKAQGGELPCESSSHGFIHSGANRCARNGAETLLTTPVEPGESENTSQGKDGWLCRREMQVIDNNDCGKYAVDAEYLLHAQRSKKPPQEAAEPEYPSEELIHSASVDHPPSAPKPEDQIKARAPYPPGTATHQSKHQSNTIPTPDDRGIHAAGNGYLHTNTNEPTRPHTPEVVVRTVASSRHNSRYLPSSPLLNLLLSQNPTPHSEYSGFWYFYLPSNPTLHGRHSHNNTTATYIQHPIMNTQFHCNQEAAMNSYFYPQNISNQAPAYLAMNTSAHLVPAMDTSLYPQQYHTNFSSFPAMPNSGHQVSATTTNFHPQYFSNATSQYPAMRPSAYQAPVMHRSVVPPNYNTPHSGYPGVPNYNNQLPAQRMFLGMQNPGLYRMVPTNTTAPANTTRYINPAILSVSQSPFHTSPSPPQPSPLANKPTVTIDLTVDDDAEGAGPKKTVESELITLPATTTNTTEAVSTKPATRPKRPYSWIESGSLLPDIPNAKKLKMSAQEVNLRQQYETRAANSTARFFLGIKPVAPTAGGAAGVPAVDWEKEVAALSTGSSSSVRTSPPKRRAKVEKKKKGKDEDAKRKDIGEGAKRKVEKGGRGELRGKFRERKKGNEVEEVVEERTEEDEEQEDEEGEDKDLVAAIEAAFDDEEDVDEEGENDELAAAIEAAFEDEEDEQENDDLAAQIEAAFEGDEEEEQGSRTVTDGDAELKAALEDPYLVPVVKEQEEWGELVIDENPLAPGEMPKP
ncbi:hypothetical protein EPUS_06983 [Endocarpon pusillum Z07020]|uniref:Uncharacterized protein n=1 Tax=Endocarpon pusillum (strain Z07020 / HMAS-L-300199) TaxID=1263415 RepID=U1GTV3_ENDPU|nr:uncharacterized protein EPUS_06983 [Endocarpon pusillum Z07020]ERF75451.1 hypothetical protein EPUS_06983 [Endocarpon pusillum Z07020]